MEDSLVHDTFIRSFRHDSDTELIHVIHMLLLLFSQVVCIVLPPVLTVKDQLTWEQIFTIELFLKVNVKDIKVDAEVLAFLHSFDQVMPQELVEVSLGY